MKMDVRAMAVTTGAFWGGAVLAVEALNLVAPRYGSGFLKMISSFYPGYKGRRTPRQVAIGATYAVIDGTLSGLCFALLYNTLARSPERKREEPQLRAVS